MAELMEHEVSAPLHAAVDAYTLIAATCLDLRHSVNVKRGRECGVGIGGHRHAGTQCQGSQVQIGDEVAKRASASHGDHNRPTNMIDEQGKRCLVALVVVRDVVHLYLVRVGQFGELGQKRPCPYAKPALVSLHAEICSGYLDGSPRAVCGNLRKAPPILRSRLKPSCVVIHPLEPCENALGGVEAVVWPGVGAHCEMQHALDDSPLPLTGHVHPEGSRERANVVVEGGHPLLASCWLPARCCQHQPGAEVGEGVEVVGEEASQHPGQIVHCPVQQSVTVAELEMGRDRVVLRVTRVALVLLRS